ncbi:MAG TPA: transcriptional regulator GcvA [Mariprofundaceae bacterium]|nr:transcriptional regulator GcvA [Mariprofundaceae bacterium]
MPDPDISHLPSLNALRAFAAAGKHLNLTAAAAELFVTPSALSHQIRSLEESLGQKLFIRSRSGLELTRAGKILLPALLSAFQQISSALSEVTPQRQPNTVTVSMLSTFAMRWFIPRLFRFQQQHPDIEVRISTSIELVDFGHDDFDCAIRSGLGSWPGTRSIRLFSERFTAVCSPSLPTREAPLDRPEDLARHTLLHAKLRPDDWRIWLHAAHLGKLTAAHEQTFETRNFAIAAAIRGLGVAIVDPLLVEEELKDGRLIQPFPQTMATESAYFYVWPERREEKPSAAIFRHWLLGEAAEMDMQG